MTKLSAMTEVSTLVTADWTYVVDTSLADGGKASPFAIIDMDTGTYNVVGTQQIYVPAVGMYPATTSPCGDHVKRELATNDVDIYVLPFDGATDEIAKWDWYPPENWDAGTVKVKPYWTAVAGAGTVQFDISGVAISHDGALDAAFGTLKSTSVTFTAADDLNVSTLTGAITIGGTPAKSAWVQMRIVRNGTTDTKAEDVELLGFMFEYTIDNAKSVG